MGVYDVLTHTHTYTHISYMHISPVCQMKWAYGNESEFAREGVSVNQGKV